MDDIIIQILQQYGEQIVNDYRRQLYQGGTNASGRLSNSVRSIVTGQDGIYEVSLSLEDYWKWVEYGRNAGKFPPIDKIKEWIQVKPVIPVAYNGKLPTIDQLSYLISRKIANEGIPAKNYLQTTLDQIDLKPLEDAITRAITNKLDDSLEEL